MRLPRSLLLARLTAEDVPSVVLLEAPPGYGKSWLARRAAGDDVIRLRGELGPLGQSGPMPSPHVLLDDAHLLTEDDVDLLLERIEDATGGGTLIIAGRIVADAIHEVTQLVDGLIIDSEALAIGAQEIIDVLPTGSSTLANRLAEAADGSVRVIATSLEQAARDRSVDAVAIASRIVRASSEAALHQLDPAQRSVVALLARAPGIDPPMLERLGGPGFVRMAVAAGVPLRRQITGALELAAFAALRGAPIDPAIAGVLADDMMQRGRVQEAISLVLDAGGHERATLMMTSMSESVAETIEPRPMLSILARLGSNVERNPELLLLRAGAHRAIGRLDEAAADIDRAVERAVSAPPQIRRRVVVESARSLVAQGQNDMAERVVRDVLPELGEGEGQTFARAHEVIGELTMESDSRVDLQQAAESFRVAASAWEACSEFARARSCRITLVLGVLIPLGRFDEALAQTGQLLGATDLSDAERSFALMAEGFVLCNSGRLDAAELRFERIADLGYLHDNPRLIGSRRGGWRSSRPGAATWPRRGGGSPPPRTRRSDGPTTSWACRSCAMRRRCWARSGTSRQRPATSRRPRTAAPCSRARSSPARSSSTPATASSATSTRRCDGRRRAGGGGSSWSPPTPRRPKATWTAPAECSRTPSGSWRRSASPTSSHSARAPSTGSSSTCCAARPAPAAAAGGSVERVATVNPTGGIRLLVMGGPIVVLDGNTELPIPAGNPQRLVGVIVANGGSVTIDQASEALWGDDDIERSRTRLRNVLLRLRRVAGDLVVRTGSGLRLAPSTTWDLHEFQRRAQDALATARVDPELAGELARVALGDKDEPVFVDFEYDDWAVAARRQVDQQRIGLLDLLSVQAEDAGDLAAAQALAERALRLDKYTDSRYVRLAELLTMQDRVAAAMAVLEDAAAVARELGDGSPGAAKLHRDELMRRAVSGV